jgi:hypothetical protein
MGGMAYTIDLRSVQAPLKERYRSDPTSALVVPIGATGIEMRTQVKVKDGVDAERAKRLPASAERYCSTLPRGRGED